MNKSLLENNNLSINETKNNQRSCKNCLKIEYNLNPFNVNSFLEEINKKINSYKIKGNDNNNNENFNNKFDDSKYERYKILEKILKEYFEILGITLNELKIDLEDKSSNYFKNSLKSRLNNITFKSKSSYFSLNSIYTKQEKIVRKKSTFILYKDSDIEKDESKESKESKEIKENTNILSFYGDNGFLKFIKNFEIYLKDEKINIKNQIYQNSINKQIIALINEISKLKKSSRLNSNKISSDISDDDKNHKDTLKKGILKNNYKINTISEENDSDNERSILEGLNVGDESFIIPFNKKKIIKIPKFEKEKENLIEIFNENYNNIIMGENIDLLTQFYLFLNYHLEEISKDDIMKKKFIDEINDKTKIKINLNQLILKIYKLAFEHSGKKKRDFPYFDFYEFLNGLSLDILKSLEEHIDKFQLELYDIYNNVYREKKKLFEKTKFKVKDDDLRFSVSILDSLNRRNRTSSDLHSSLKELNKKSGNLSSKVKIDDLILFNISQEYIINESSDFNPSCEPGSIHILYELCALISAFFPSLEHIKKIDEILDISNKFVNTITFKELIGELRIIDLNELTNDNSKICFWLNCFNYLLLYTIFYKKWKISGEKSWKYFLQNVKYNIGGNAYSFNDMQYIIFGKLYFFPSGYKPPDVVKKNLFYPNNKLTLHH